MANPPRRNWKLTWAMLFPAKSPTMIILSYLQKMMLLDRKEVSGPLRRFECLVACGRPLAKTTDPQEKCRENSRAESECLSNAARLGGRFELPHLQGDTFFLHLQTFQVLYITTVEHYYLCV